MDVSISLPEVVEAAGEDLDVLPVELELWPLGREPLADARPRKVLVHTDPGHEVYSSVQQQQRPHLTDYSRPGLQGNMTFFTLSLTWQEREIRGLTSACKIPMLDVWLLSIRMYILQE